MIPKIAALTGAGFTDIAAAMKFEPSSIIGSSLAAATDQLLRRRAEIARSIFLEELGEGIRPPSDPGEVDEFVAILYRYLSKASEGAARLNLRPMARVFKGQLEGKGLYASDFLRYSELLASLSREEVILLATRRRLRLEFEKRAEVPQWSDTKDVNENVVKELVPSVFATRLHLNATLSALQRTGFVWPAAATTGGGFVWEDTPLLEEVAHLAQFEAALEREEDADQKAK